MLNDASLDLVLSRCDPLPDVSVKVELREASGSHDMGHRESCTPSGKSRVHWHLVVKQPVKWSHTNHAPLAPASYSRGWL